jgi:Tfp pilus assembly protein PilV
MKNLSAPARGQRGFTVAEVMITMTIMMLVSAGALAVFLNGSKAMYKDMQRLATDAALRKITLQVAKETLDSSEFYVFPTYASLDGSVDLTADLSPLYIDSSNTEVAYGDCLVLVTRVSIDMTAKVRQFRIYYRAVTSADQQGELRYYEGTDYGAGGTTTSLTNLLNTINLRTTPTFTGSRVLASVARGRLKSGTDTCTYPGTYYPIFSTESTGTTPTNESVSLNVEVVNGSSANNLLSSSSFNYTISPRR